MGRNDKEILVAFSYCGDHIKSTVGHISPSDHARALLACMDNINPENKYPLLVSSTKYTIDLPEEDERMINWQIYKKAAIISTRENPGHQRGACWIIRYAMEYAGFMGYEYMFFTADDVLFKNKNVVENSVKLMRERDLGYLGSDWQGEKALNTQVFCIRVSDFVDVVGRKFLINPIVFAGRGTCLEHYMYHIVTSHGINYEINNTEISYTDYIHTHDARLILKIADDIKNSRH
jgi:hypothetical protein